ncbi:MAG: hypothetical protein ACM3MK_13990 [Chitinophagales bacterium]
MDTFSSFQDYCEAMRELTTTVNDPQEIVSEGQKIQARLVADPSLILDQLAAFIAGDKDSMYWPVDLNDLTLYRDKDKLFSVRLFVWEAHTPYPIHDHGAWGVVGGLANQVRESKYHRLDDGSREGYAELKIKSEAVLHPGETTWVLPLNDGIHRMEAVGDTTGLTLHTYGRPVRTGFINSFMYQSHGVYKLYPMRTHRQILAVKALESIGGGQSKDILEQISRDNNQIIKDVSLKALKNISSLEYEPSP